MRKWQPHVVPTIKRVERVKILKIPEALGKLFPITGLAIAVAFGILVFLDVPKKVDVDEAEANLTSARELRDLSFKTQGILYNLARFGGALRPGEMDKATADYEQSVKKVDEAKRRRDQIRAGRKPVWESGMLLGICIIFLRPISKSAAFVLITVGLSTAVYFYFLFDTAIDGTHNLGRLQDRLLGCIIGLTVFLTGVLMRLPNRRTQ